MKVRSQRPRVAVIGCGAWGSNLARCFAALGALEAVVDRQQQTVEALVELFGCRGLEVADVLADPAIEAVAVATQPSLHHDIATAALAAGKHVFVEKPLTLNFGDSEDLVHRARQSGRVLMAGHILQYHPGFMKLREIVTQGTLGRLQRIHATRLNLGAVRREEDALWCLAPHDISMILALTGTSPASVEAFGEVHLRQQTADAVTLRLGFPQGEQALVHVSWLHPFKEHRLSVIGSAGMAVFDDCAPWDRKLQLYPHRVTVDGEQPLIVRAEPVAVPVEPQEPLMQECAHFLDCVREGREPVTGGAEALAVMDVLARAARAMESAPEQKPPRVAAAGL